VLPTAVDDAKRVGYGHVLLSDDLHLARVDFVNVVESHYDTICHGPGLGRLFRLQPETKHLIS
jgi:hypothetical protein